MFNLLSSERIIKAKDWAKREIAKLSLEEKIGQLMIVRLNCEFLNVDNEYIKNIVDLIKTYNISGFYISATGPYEFAIISNYFQEISKIPLMVSADFESGVGRLLRNTTYLPKQMLIGATGDPKVAYQCGKITALESRAVGVQVIYSPVADVNSNPLNPIVNIRSFGSNPDNVAKFVEAFIKAAQENGAAATAKHFPGHGDTATDSHISIPIINKDINALYQTELKPFIAAIKSGVMFIMISHIALPAIEPDKNLPATLSYNVTTKLLKEELKYDGLICTDGMDMHAITNNFTIEDAAVKAILAGSDLVLISPNPERCFYGLLNAVKEEKISEDRLDESVMKILQVKAQLGLNNERFVDIDKIKYHVASKANLEAAKKMFESGITLLEDKNKILPLNNNKISKPFILNFFDTSFWEKEILFALSSEPSKRFSNHIEHNIPYEISENMIQEITDEIKDCDFVMLNVFIKVRPFKGSVALSANQIKLINKINQTNKNILLVIYGSPYIVSEFSNIPTIILGYDQSPETINAVYRAIFGEIEIKGKLPVEIPELYTLNYSKKVK